MADPEDIVEIGGIHSPRPPARDAGQRKRFLSVWFRCCHSYGRLYRNREETAYEGQCPRCGAPVHALIGSNGTTRRIFEAR